MSDSDSEFEDLTAAISSLDDKVEEEVSGDESNKDSEDLSESDKELPAVKPKKRRRIVNPEEEKELNKFLFGDKAGFIKNLEGNQVFFTDVAGETENSQLAKETSVWHDSDDEDNKKSAIDGDQLKRKFERITGSNPSWAQLDRKAKEVDSDDDDEISKTVGHLAKKPSSKNLPKGELNFKRLSNINKATLKEGRISSVEFHPKSTVGIVAGLKGIVSMFAIDGRENKKIHSIKYDHYPIFSCKLNSDGDELIVGGAERYIHMYNLLSGKKFSTRLPKGVSNMKTFEQSPCGKYLAVIGEYGEIHLLHSLTKELLCTLKQEYQSTSIHFSVDSKKLFSHSDDNEVTVFDLRRQRVEHRFIDDGCVNGTSLAISENGKLIATGSRQGFVNIYNYDDVLANKYPKPEKAISNLTTEIAELRFNPTTEMLAICSADMNNAVKIVQLPTATVFSNFPSQHEEMGKTTTMAFSPAGGYFATGTIGGESALYRLRHYNNY